jgi:homoprotocatechuate degradation regulator HpaR
MTAPTLRPFSRSLPMALLRARETVMRHFRPSLKARNLTEQQWRVLRALEALEGIDVTGLAARTFLLAPSLTRILRDLDSRQLVRRRPDPRDGRASVVALSSAGRKLLSEVGAESEAIYAELEARIGKARIEALMVMLKEIETELSSSADERVDFPK